MTYYLPLVKYKSRSYMYILLERFRVETLQISHLQSKVASLLRNIVPNCCTDWEVIVNSGVWKYVVCAQIGVDTFWEELSTVGSPGRHPITVATDPVKPALCGRCWNSRMSAMNFQCAVGILGQYSRYDSLQLHTLGRYSSVSRMSLGEFWWARSLLRN